MKKQMKFALLVAMLATSFMTTGCSALMKKYFAGNKNKNRRAKREAARVKSMAAEKAAYEKLIAMSDCAEVESLFKKARSYSDRKAGLGMVQVSVNVGSQAAKCKKYGLIFKYLTRGRHMLTTKIMEGIEAKGYDVYGGFGDWLKSQEKPFLIPYGNHVIISMKPWMIKHGKRTKKYCGLFIDSANKAGSARYRSRQSTFRGQFNKFVQRQLIDLAFLAACKQQTSYFVKQLLSNDWRDRRQACFILGRWGTKRALRKVRSLSRTDSYYTIRRRVKIRPVRETCLEAAGRIDS